MTEATQIVHWPGKDTPMCDKHAQQARGLANAMGFTLSCTVIVANLYGLIHITCKNCENEAAKAQKAWDNRPTEL